MPVEQHFFEQFGLNHVRASEPFALTDLTDQMKSELARNAPKSWLSAPLLLDLSDVTLLKFEPQDFRRMIRQRQAIAGQIPGGPAAFVAGDEGSFGMLRMYTIYSELSGLRKEDITIVTTELAEAVHWLFPRLNDPQEDEAALLVAMSAPTYSRAD